VKASLTLVEARRLALAAQLSPGARRQPTPAAAAIGKLVDHLGLLQIDSVNVLSRSHYLPVFSRLGAYDQAILDHLTYSREKRRFFEYWAHEASFLPFSLFPLLRWRMDDARQGIGIYGSLASFAKDQAPYIEGIVDQIRKRGPIAVRDLQDPGKRFPGWWGWSPGKVALEYLFWTGEVTAATRRNFERLYDLTERVIPADIIASPPMLRADAIRRLMLLSARALGIATFSDLRDYFRLPLADAKLALSQLVEDKSLEQVMVDGWRNPAFVASGTRLPRGTPECRSLISPFDPLIWERTRTERLFDFSYRIEIYTPAPKRRHGYYVLPFLLRDRFTARLCLKADRKRSLLLVNAAHRENGTDETETVQALKTELELLAEFLGLSGISIARKGSLAKALKKAVG
jgi:uncharacterized protein YcaQ